MYLSESLIDQLKGLLQEPMREVIKNPSMDNIVALVAEALMSGISVGQADVLSRMPDEDWKNIISYEIMAEKKAVRA